MLEKELEKLLIDHKPIVCEECGNKVYYDGAGKYVCIKCEHITYDDYGKVRKYLDEHGTSTMVEISEATGVSRNILQAFLVDGRFQIPEGSKYYLSCRKCGCSLKYGSYCNSCYRETTNELIHAFEVGTKPKVVEENPMAGKMHFAGRKR